MSANAYPPALVSNTEIANSSGAPILSLRVASTILFADLSTYLALNPATQYVINDCNLTPTYQSPGTGGSGQALQNVTGKMILGFDKQLAGYYVTTVYNGNALEARAIITTPAVAASPILFTSSALSSTTSTYSGANFSSTNPGGGVITDGTNYYVFASNAINQGFLGYVAVGSIGTALTSITLLSAGTNLIAGVYGAGRTNPYVYVGTAGAVYSSTTGTAVPASRTSGTSNTLYSVAYSSSLGMYVAVGTSGTIITSTDGATWTVQTSGTTNTLNGITWTGSYFCAVGASGTVLTSTNGTSWTARTTGAGSVTWQMVGSTLSNTRTVALTSAGLLYACTDGIGATWSQIANFNVVSSVGGFNTPIISQTGFNIVGYNGITPINSKMTSYAGIYDAAAGARIVVAIEYGNAAAFAQQTLRDSGGYVSYSSQCCINASGSAFLTFGTSGSNTAGYLFAYTLPTLPTLPFEIFNMRNSLTL